MGGNHLLLQNIRATSITRDSKSRIKMGYVARIQSKYLEANLNMNLTQLDKYIIVQF